MRYVVPTRTLGPTLGPFSAISPLHAVPMANTSADPQGAETQEGVEVQGGAAGKTLTLFEQGLITKEELGKYFDLMRNMEEQERAEEEEKEQELLREKERQVAAKVEAAAAVAASATPPALEVPSDVVGFACLCGALAAMGLEASGLSSLSDVILPVGVSLGGGAGALIATREDPLGRLASMVGSQISGGAVGLGKALTEACTSSVTNATTTTVDSLTALPGKLAASLVGAVQSGLAAAALNAERGLQSAVNETVEKTVGGLQSAVLSAPQAVGGAVVGGVSTALKEVPSKLIKGGPSKVLQPEASPLEPAAVNAPMPVPQAEPQAPTAAAEASAVVSEDVSAAKLPTEEEQKVQEKLQQLRASLDKYDTMKRRISKLDASVQDPAQAQVDVNGGSCASAGPEVDQAELPTVSLRDAIEEQRRQDIVKKLLTDAANHSVKTGVPERREPASPTQL
ncbi:unnamed protein product [Chrysoparadoxa australica]